MVNDLKLTGTFVEYSGCQTMSMSGKSVIGEAE